MTSPERYDTPQNAEASATHARATSARVGHFGMAHPQGMPTHTPYQQIPQGQGTYAPQSVPYTNAQGTYPYPTQGGYPAQLYGGAPARSLDMPPTTQKKKRRWVVVLIIFLIMCLIAAGALLFFGQGANKATRQGTAGQLEGKTQEEIQAELDRVVDEGMFNISIANVVQFADGTSEGELRIENVPGNHYLMRVAIILDDTGEQVYETDMIEPNHHIQRDALDVVLPAGQYSATAMFSAYDQQTEEQVGQAAAKILIQVDS